MKQPQTHRLLPYRQLQLFPHEERLHLQLHTHRQKGTLQHGLIRLRGPVAEGGRLLLQHLFEAAFEVPQERFEGGGPSLAEEMGEEGGLCALEEVGKLLPAVLLVEQAILVVILVELPQEDAEVLPLAALLVVGATLVGIFGADEGSHVLEDVGLFPAAAVEPTEVEDEEEVEMDLLGGIPLLRHESRAFIFSPLFTLRKSNIILRTVDSGPNRTNKSKISWKERTARITACLTSTSIREHYQSE